MINVRQSMIKKSANFPSFLIKKRSICIYIDSAFFFHENKEFQYIVSLIPSTIHWERLRSKYFIHDSNFTYEKYIYPYSINQFDKNVIFHSNNN